MMVYYLFTFGSTHLAIETERSLKPHMAVTMIPTPRELTASCGLSLQIQEETLASALERLADSAAEGITLYRVEKPESGPRVYEAMEWRR